MKNLVLFIFLFSSVILFGQSRPAFTDVSENASDLNFAPAETAVIDTIHYMNGSPSLYTYNGGAGYVTGTNTYADLGKYQRFDFTGSYTLSSTFAAFGKRTAVGAADVITLVVRTVGPDGAPDALLYSEDIVSSNITALVYTTFAINPPLVISDSVFVGFEWVAATDDSIAILSDAQGLGDGAERSWEKWSDNTFMSIFDASTLNTDLWIGIVVDDVVVPVELTSFSANVSANNVTLNWATASETNNNGFEVERKSADGEFVSVAFVDGKGTTTDAQNYSFTEELPAGKYSYRLKQTDFDGSFTYTNTVEADVVVPAEFRLMQNYPNPFNPSTTITFSLVVDSKVNLKVFNALGEEVAELLNSSINAGTHDFNFDASFLNSGIYYYKLSAAGIDGNNLTSVKKMMLIK